MNFNAVHFLTHCVKYWQCLENIRRTLIVAYFYTVKDLI